MNIYKHTLFVLTFLMLLLSCEDLAKMEKLKPSIDPAPDRETNPSIDDSLNIDPIVINPIVLDTSLLIISREINLDKPKINLSPDTVYSSYLISDEIFKRLPLEYEGKINSFYLPKGFLIVFAENSDGTGESACYVAVEKTIKANLPQRLQNKISYVRYRHINNPTKKGSANTNEITVIASGAAWYYSWGFTRPSFSNQQFVPMTWGKTSSTNKNAVYLVKRTDVDHLLSFNEPDSKGQSNVLVDTAIARYKIMQKTGLRLGSPVTTQDQAFGSGKWLTQFMTLADKEKLRVDYIALHWYDWGNEKNNKPTDILNAEAIFKRFVVYVERIRTIYPRKPLWITEFNANINRTSVEVHKKFMKLATDWMENQDDIERYAYFFPSTLPEKDTNNNLTEIGAYWKTITSQKSFKSNIIGDAIIIE